MKAILILMTLVTFTRGAFSQDENKQFRVDCDLVAILPGIDSEWSEWFDANNTFVINANENKDIIHHRGDGETLVYRNLGGLETLYTQSGERYQIINVLDEDGNPMDFQLFDNPSIGVKLRKEDMAIQFFTNQ
jgi:hypothetical protein